MAKCFFRRPVVPRPTNHTCSSRNAWFVWPCRRRRQGRKTTLFCKLCGFLTLAPQASQKTLGQKKHFGIPLRICPHPGPGRCCETRRVGEGSPQDMENCAGPGPAKVQRRSRPQDLFGLRTGKQNIYFCFDMFVAGCRPNLGPGTCPTAPA